MDRREIAIMGPEDDSITRALMKELMSKDIVNYVPQVENDFHAKLKVALKDLVIEGVEYGPTKTPRGPNFHPKKKKRKKRHK